jgi:hypothetical protein
MYRQRFGGTDSDANASEQTANQAIAGADQTPAERTHMTNYIVVCTDDGSYYLATRQVFATLDDAYAYLATIAPSRTPLVIAGRFAQLRFPS